MAYSDFSLDRAITDFQLETCKATLFVESKSVSPSDWLVQSLDRGRSSALPAGNEKARSEFLVAPILLELKEYYAERLEIYSGRNLDVEAKRGLSGECDFLLGRGPGFWGVRSPLLAVVEAKRNDIDIGLGQCVAQMVGIQSFNESQAKENSETVEAIFGCVTTGEIWQFLRLQDKTLTMDRDRFYIDRLDRILGCLQACLDPVLGSNAVH